MTNNHKNDNLIILITAICVTIAQLAGCIYVPSLPAIAHEFAVSVGDVQASASIFFISFGLSGLIYGPLSDYYGRKPIFLVSSVIILVSSGLMICAHDLNQIILARFIQGLGVGGIPIFARTVMRDSFTGKHLNRAMSLLAIGITVTPALAPLLGALFEYYLGWRSSFVFLMLYCSLIVIFAWFILPETNTNSNRNHSTMKLSTIFQDFAQIFCNVKFLRCSICALFTYSCVVICLIITPFLFQQQLRIPGRIYGALMILPVFGGLLGNLISIRLNYHWSVPRIMYLGVSIIIISALLMLANLLCHKYIVVLIIIPIITMMVGVTIVFANSLAGALKPFPNKVGRAAALLGLIQIGGSGLISSGISCFHITTLSGLGLGLLSFGLILLLSYTVLLKWDNLLSHH